MGAKIRGRVVAGGQLGRRLGFPTANLDTEPEDQIADGGYAARVTVDGRTYGALGYVGHRPTVNADGRRVIEVHLLDFDADLYGKTIEVELLQFVRPDERFSTVEALRERIEQDKDRIINILKTCL